MFNKYVGFCRLDVGHEAEFGPDQKKSRGQRRRRSCQSYDNSLEKYSGKMTGDKNDRTSNETHFQTSKNVCLYFCLFIVSIVYQKKIKN